MRTIVCTEIGSPDLLTIEDRPALEPSAGQLVIDVKAAGVNFVDGLFVLGKYQIKPPLPFTPGSEVAGIVSAVGPGVNAFAAGDRVLASCGLGGFSEQIAAFPEQVQRIPGTLDFARAATCMQSYCTAWFALTRRTTLQSGDALLVLGAGGGVGLAAVDVGRSLGARVIAAASSEDKRAAATAAGAAVVVDSTATDLKDRIRQVGGIDVAYDPVGGELSEVALRVLAPSGRLLVIGFAAGPIPRLPLNHILLRNRSVIGVDWGAWSMADPDANRSMLAVVLARIGDGTLSPVAPREYPLAEAGRALHDQLERRVTGKAVLVV
ncbi:MAG TPA: NADPH:quinone oxidoreductase family protein [Candidatus Binatia bacterium]|jgi:NADPH2:quinone reductase|nr:NADPH:quinone oxidoreductase family protein [Candidatus Binatia bacterium]